MLGSVSATVALNPVTVSILPPRIMTYELAEGANEVEHIFEAAAVPEGSYRFEWDFGDASPVQSTEGGSSSLSHTYTGTGTWYPSVTLYSLSGAKLAEDRITIIAESAAQSGRMDGNWVNYGIYYGGGSLESLNVDITLTISGGQFSMTKSGSDGDSWTGGGYVEEYTDAQGEKAYKLVPDTGNAMDDSDFATYFGLERGGLYLKYSSEYDELTLGTTGAKLYFERE